VLIFFFAAKWLPLPKKYIDDDDNYIIYARSVFCQRPPPLLAAASSISSTVADRVEEDGPRNCLAAARAAGGTTTATGFTTRVARWAAHGFVWPPPGLAAKTTSAPPQRASPSTAGIGKADGSGQCKEERRMQRQ